MAQKNIIITKSNFKTIKTSVEDKTIPHKPELEKTVNVLHRMFSKIWMKEN